MTVIKYSTAVAGDCIQIGKFNYLGGNGERCSHYYDWPDNWNTGATSGSTYSASIDVSAATYNWPEGEYIVSFSNNSIILHLIVSYNLSIQMCYGDGNLASTFDTYNGDITYSSLTLTPAEFEVTSGSGELLEVCVYT